MAGDRSAVVSWKAPVFTGGAAITQYVVTAAPGGRSCSTSGAGRSCVVSGLTAGTQYSFTVTAKNTAGVGVASSASGKVKALVAPGKVRDLMMEGVKAGVVSLSWKAPTPVSAAMGGSAVTGYRVRYGLAGKSEERFTFYADVKGTSASVRALAKGTYYFTVRAINAAGVGDFVLTTKAAKIG